MLNKYFLLSFFLFLSFNQTINAEFGDAKSVPIAQPKIEIDLHADQAYLENLKRQGLINSSSLQDEAEFEEEEEEWTQWKPLQNLSRRYYIESISDNIHGFTIVLANALGDSPKVKIKFEDGVLAFRNTEETFTLSTIEFLDEKYGCNFYGSWTFFKVENSEYLKWLLEQSVKFSDPYGIMHYSIITDDEMLDIAAIHEPTVTFVTENERCAKKINSMGAKTTLCTFNFGYFIGCYFLMGLRLKLSMIGVPPSKFTNHIDRDLLYCRS